MSEKQHFHPSALLIYIMSGIRVCFFLFFLLFVSGIPLQYKVAGIFAISIGILIQTVIKYRTQTYQITTEKIILYHGIFVKKETDIPYDRIQTVKQRQWFFFKPFDVIQLLIETGSGSDNDAEGSLPAVKREVFDKIEAYRQGEQLKEEHEQEERPFYHMTTNDIFLFSLTDLKVFLVLIPIITFISEWLLDFILAQVDSYMHLFVQVGWYIYLAIFIIFILLIALISIVKNFIYYYKFTVWYDHQTVTIEQGLFERKTQNIPLNKIQDITIHHQVFRQMLGMSSVELTIIGGQEAEGESNLTTQIFILPLISTKELYAQLAVLMPGFEIREPKINYTSRNKVWYFIRWTLLIMLPLTIISWYFSVWLGIILAFFMVVLSVSAILDSWLQGYDIMSVQMICIQHVVGFTRTQTFLLHSKILAVTKKNTLWLEKKQIGHISLKLKVGNAMKKINMRFVDMMTIHEVINYFRPKF